MAPILVPIDPTLKPDQVAVVVSKIVEKAQAGDVVHLLVVTYKHTEQMNHRSDPVMQQNEEKADKEVAEAYYIPTLDEKKISHVFEVAHATADHETIALCITKAAATISAGLIIMWDHHENFLKSLVIGNTTKIVQKESFIPVEIVNPK
eukprot:gene19501-26166_t